jgi:hypothetical protein
MRIRLVAMLAAGVSAAVFTVPAFCGAPAIPGTRSAPQSSPLEVRLPKVDYTFVFDARPATGRGRPPGDDLLHAVARWLEAYARLAAPKTLPRVSLESPVRIANFRFTGLLTDDADVSAAVPRSRREVVAAYDGATRTIYLPEGWRGATPAEVSMLVHEMVHHLQREAQERFACPELAEGTAYAAQERWLQTFGRSLAQDFEIDPFTLLVVSQCAP